MGGRKKRDEQLDARVLRWCACLTKVGVLDRDIDGRPPRRERSAKRRPKVAASLGKSSGKFVTVTTPAFADKRILTRSEALTPRSNGVEEEALDKMVPQ